MTRLLPLLCLLLCSCAHRNPVISANRISVEYADKQSVAGRWDHERATIYVSSLTNRWTVAHELAHACDSLGIDYPTAVLWLGNVPMPREMAAVREVLTETQRNPGPHAHWYALNNLYGAQAVRHPEILAALRIGTLTAKASK